MPFCPQCGAQQPEGAQFCGACGAPLIPAPPQPVQAAPQPQPAKNKKTGLIILLLILLALAGGVYYYLTKQAAGIEPTGTPSQDYLPGGDDGAEVLDLQDLIDAGTVPDGFQRFEDMDPQELAAYLNNMLKEEKADLRKERAKGSKADPDVLRDLEERIEITEKQLRDYGLQVQP